MVRKNIINEICEAITETKKILSSPDVKNEMLKGRLEKWKVELLNELFEAHKKGRSRSKKSNPNRTNTMKEEKHDRKANVTVSSTESSK